MVEGVFSSGVVAVEGEFSCVGGRVFSSGGVVNKS